MAKRRSSVFSGGPRSVEKDKGLVPEHDLGLWHSPEDYTSEVSSPACSITAWASGTVSGHFITLAGSDIEIPKSPNHIACNSNSNTTIISEDNTWFNVWNDEDQDGDHDLQDQFPLDSSQWDDLDGDGYGDNPLGNFSDDCITNPGTSSIISGGGSTGVGVAPLICPIIVVVQPLLSTL